MKKGTGKFTVNKMSIEDYFHHELYVRSILQPFAVLSVVNEFDVMCTVKGGGIRGQVDALRHGISRALDSYNPVLFHKTLRMEGLLTRDDRITESKKYGQKKARKKFQFSKR